MAARRWLTAAMMVAIATTLGLSAAAQDPARAKSAYDRAIALEAQGNHAAALALLWEASGAAPRDPDIQNRLGEALDRIGALDAAIDAYRRALAERPSFRQASNNLMLALVKVGRGLKQSRSRRSSCSKRQPIRSRYFTLGLAQSEQDYEAAIRTFRKALELAPRHTLARYNLALVLRRADRLDEALHGAAAIDRNRAARRGVLHDGRDLLAPGRSRPGGAGPPFGGQAEAELRRCALRAWIRSEGQGRPRCGRDVLPPGDRDSARRVPRPTYA